MTVSSQARALARLEPADRRRVRSVLRSLRDVWSDHEYLLAAHRTIRGLLPDATTNLYELDGGRLGAVAHDILGRESTSWSDIRASDRLPAHVRFHPWHADRFANRVVDERELFDGVEAALDAFREEVLSKNDAFHQLRVALYDSDEFLAYIGFFRRRGRPFGERERDLAAAVVPALRDGLRAVQAARYQTLDESGVANLLDAFDEPSFLIDERGTVVVASRSAARRFQKPPNWLPARPAALGDSATSRLASVTRLRLRGRSYFLVIPRGVEERAPGVTRLPPHLDRIARMAAAGLSDKEIAALSGLSQPSVRTYVTRIYRALGVHGRVELAHAMSGRKQDGRS